jgi:hypothetical protein
MTQGKQSERKQSERPARRAKRLSAALRENLKRRKAQARARAASSARPEGPSVSAGNADEDKALR